MKKRYLFENIVRLIFTLCGFLSVAFVIVITVFLTVSGLPAIKEIGFFRFMFGKVWSPTSSDPKYGILAFILTSFAGTFGAILLGVPIGILCAAYIAKCAPKGIKKVLVSSVELLSGIPSVIYASQTAISAVPKEYEEGSLALGATKTETLFKITLPAAKSGILTAVVLGIGRSIGEAMAVMMVSGNVPNMPKLFGSVRFLTTAVASEMSYSSGLQRKALFSIALVLFIFILIINCILNFVVKRKDK